MMMKLAKNLQESHHTNDTKQGLISRIFFFGIFFFTLYYYSLLINIHFIIRSYGDSWLSILKIHENIGENRVKLASAIQEISEDVTVLYKDIDKARKNVLKKN